MGYSYKCYSDTKQFMKKYVNAEEGAIIYGISKSTAPDGYVLNPDEQKVTFTYVDDKTPVIKESLTLSDDRQKLDMSVTKLDSEDNTPIAGAVFGLFADEDIKNVDGKVIIEKGTLLEKATSDENGKIAFVKDYPFAKYVAKELVKPAGYVTNEEVVTFDTKYQGQDVKTAVYTSEYKNTPTTFEFTKTDITSVAELTGATLTVLTIQISMKRLQSRRNMKCRIMSDNCDHKAEPAGKPGGGFAFNAKVRAGGE